MSEILHVVAYTLVGLVLLTGGGNWACRLMFRTTALTGAPEATLDEEPRAGRIIGWLERLVVAAGLLMESWELLAAVIALKSVARFTKLDDRRFAEYFLVGSLFSILWAVLVTTGWIAYDRHLGSDVLSVLSHADTQSMSAGVPEKGMAGSSDVSR